MYTYRITSALLIGDYSALLKAVFPEHTGEPVIADANTITVTFASPQTPADLGPLVKVEIVTA